MSTEQWKPINGYEGIYEISNLGRVKRINKASNPNTPKERLLKERINGAGYFIVALYKNKRSSNYYRHTLVWEAFGNKNRSGLHIDHIDNNKLNNRIDNLQLLTNRENTIKSINKQTKTSRYTGVSFYHYKKTPRWRAGIWRDGKSKTIGYFDTEQEAHLAYQKALENI